MDEYSSKYAVVFSVAGEEGKTELRLNVEFGTTRLFKYGNQTGMWVHGYEIPESGKPVAYREGFDIRYDGRYRRTSEPEYIREWITDNWNATEICIEAVAPGMSMIPGWELLGVQ